MSCKPLSGSPSESAGPSPVAVREPVVVPPKKSLGSHEPMGMGSALLVLLTAIIWGATGVSNQFALDSLPPYFLGFARFALAAVFMIGWCFVERAPLLPRRGQWGATWVMSALLCAQIATFNVGNAQSNSSHASILVNSYIFWVAAYECLVQRTFHLNGRQLSGLILSALGCGCLLLATGESPPEHSRDIPTLKGDALLALSGLILGVKILYTKHSVRNIRPGTLILWHDALGCLMLLGLSLVVGERMRAPMTQDSWIAVLFSGLIISGFCFGANALMLRRHGASQVSVFSFCTPIFGVALGVWLRGDELSIWLIVAGGLTAIGIFLVNFTPKPQSVSEVSL